MTDLVHWRQRDCGEHEAHKPHAYFDRETYICKGVSPTEAFGFSLEQFSIALRANMERMTISLAKAIESLNRMSRR